MNGLILRCLEKNKEKRYQSAEEVRKELERIEQGLPTTAREVARKRPLTSREITVKFELKKLFLPGLALLLIVAAAFVLRKVLPRKKALLPPSGKPTVAILYFENNTGEESLENWRSGLSDLMIADLSQSKFIDVLGSDQVYSVLSKLNLLEKKRFSSEDLKKVASETGANHIVRGSYMTAGPKFIINVSLFQALSGRAISAFKEEGTGEESIPDLIDKITVRLKTDLVLTEEQIAGDIDWNVGKITTRSPEALKNFLVGYKYERHGQQNLAQPFLERAISLDPDFGMAYVFLSYVHNTLGHPKEAAECRQKAFELSQKLPERDRYIILGTFYYHKTQASWDKAIDAYNSMLNIYPDHPDVLFILISTYASLEEWEKATQSYEKIRHFRGYGGPLMIPSGVSRSQGLYDKAEEVLEYLLNASEHPNIRHWLAHTYLAQGKYDQARAEVDKALPFCQSTFPVFLYINFLTRGNIHLCQEELQKAEDSYRKLLGIEIKPRRLFGSGVSPLFIYCRECPRSQRMPYVRVLPWLTNWMKKHGART